MEEQFSIPTSYGDDRIVLLVKDPWWLYAYWDIQSSTERAARGQLLPHEVAGLQSVLRVYDVTGVEYPAQPAQHSFDIGLSGLATNWYIHTNAPNRSFIVEIGLLTNSGRFLLLARSNRVTTPRCEPSEVIDDAWATTEEAYAKLLGGPMNLGMGGSPTAWARRLSQLLFSGSWGSRQGAVQGVWFRVNTELVIYGTTDPKARVTIQGQPVAVRKDGSFSHRAALPAGTQTITIEVTAADGRQTRSVTPVVTLAGSLGFSDGRAQMTQTPTASPEAGSAPAA